MSILAEDRQFLDKMNAADEIARATPCDFPNCNHQGHDGAEDPADWGHEIFEDRLHGGWVYLTIYVKRGEYTFYADIQCTDELNASDFETEASKMEDAARLIRLYGQRLAALNRGEQPN